MRRTIRAAFLLVLFSCSLLLTGCPKKKAEEEKASQTVDSSFEQAYPAAQAPQYSQPAAPVAQDTAAQAAAAQAAAAQVTAQQKAAAAAAKSSAVKAPTRSNASQSGLSQAELDAWLKKALAGGFSKSKAAEPGSSGDDKVPDGQGEGAAALNAAGAQPEVAKTILPENARMTADEKRRVHEAKIQGQAEAYRQAYDRLRDVLTNEGANSANAAKVLADYKEAVSALNTSKQNLIQARQAVDGDGKASLTAALGGNATGGSTGDGGSGESSSSGSAQGESWSKEAGFQRESAPQSEAAPQKESAPAKENAPAKEGAPQGETGFQGENFQSGDGTVQEGAGSGTPGGDSESGTAEAGGSTGTTPADEAPAAPAPSTETTPTEGASSSESRSETTTN